MFSFSFIYPRLGDKEPGNPKMPTGIDQKGPTKKFSLPTRETRKGEPSKTITSLLMPTSQKNYGGEVRLPSSGDGKEGPHPPTGMVSHRLHRKLGLSFVLGREEKLDSQGDGEDYVGSLD